MESAGGTFRPAIFKALSYPHVSHPCWQITAPPHPPCYWGNCEQGDGVSMENSKRGWQVQSFEVQMQEDINPALEGLRSPYPAITALWTVLWEEQPGPEEAQDRCSSEQHPGMKMLWELWAWGCPWGKEHQCVGYCHRSLVATYRASMIHTMFKLL